MTTDPYAPPAAPINPDQRAAGPVKSVLVGLAIDIGGSFVTSLVLGMIWGMMLMSSATTPEKLEAAIAEGLPSWFNITATTLGCGFSVLGGFVCTRMARRSDYLLGAIMGAISVAVGALLSMGMYSLQQSVGLAVLGFACVMVGTRLAIFRS